MRGQTRRAITLLIALVLVALAVAQPTVAGVLSVPAASRTTVPQLLGLQIATAQKRLHKAGLASRVVYVKSLALVGSVVAQRPKAGVNVRLGTRVSLSISSGPGP